MSMNPLRGAGVGLVDSVDPNNKDTRLAPTPEEAGSSPSDLPQTPRKVVEGQKPPLGMLAGAGSKNGNGENGSKLPSVDECQRNPRYMYVGGVSGVVRSVEHVVGAVA